MNYHYIQNLFFSLCPACRDLDINKVFLCPEEEEKEKEIGVPFATQIERAILIEDYIDDRIENEYEIIC